MQPTDASPLEWILRSIRQTTGDENVAGFVLPDTFGETIGGRLATTVSGWLRDEFAPPQGAPLVEGPHFAYADNPALFLGRRGRGPLRVAWDTNLLIDYFEYGRELWEGQSLPALVPLYGEELEALQIIMAVWILRDIRFHILTATLSDARQALSPRRLEQRVEAFREFAGALSFVGDEYAEREAPPLLLPDAELQRALHGVPAGNDRRLVEEAVRQCLHVFLTRDHKVLSARAAFRPFGLFIGSPLDLLQQLAACGTLHCLTDPRFAYWPLPDRTRVTHLYHATLAGPYRADGLDLFEVSGS